MEEPFVLDVVLILGRTIIGAVLVFAGVLKLKAGPSWFLQQILAYELIKGRVALTVRISLVVGLVSLLIGCAVITTSKTFPEDDSGLIDSTVPPALPTVLVRSTMPGEVLNTVSPTALPITVADKTPTVPFVIPTTKHETILSQGITERVNIASDGAQLSDPGIPPDDSSPAISADGRFVAFSSNAIDLVANDTNNAYDVFVYDRHTGQTERVSIASNGVQALGDSYGATISADGRWIAYQSSGLFVEDKRQSGIFVHDRQTGVTELVSVNSEGVVANGLSHNASISANGQFIAFVSEASNLVGNDTNGWLDIFVHDRQTGQTERVNVSYNGEQSNGWSHHPHISGDGRYVAYISDANNLVSDDINGPNIFIYDRLMGGVEQISVGEPERVRVSTDGHWITFCGHGQTYIYDRQLKTPKPISISADYCDISANGRYLVFSTVGEAQVLIYDQQTNQTQLASVAVDGTPSFGFAPSISADGCVVVFISILDNLVADDTNGGFDIFVHERSEC
jgi:Tol biopolymer transport system component